MRVVYEFVPPDSNDEKAMAQGLDRAFDVLFDAVLRVESDARKLSQKSKKNKMVLASEAPLDNFA